MKMEKLDEVLAREPFRPFVLETVGGRLIAINEQDQILRPKRRPELLIIFDDSGFMHLVEAEAVASISAR